MFYCVYGLMSEIKNYYYYYYSAIIFTQYILLYNLYELIDD